MSLPLVVLLSGAAVFGCGGSTEPRRSTVSPPNPRTLVALTSTSLDGVVTTEVTPAPTVLLKDQNGQPMQGVDVVFDFVRLRYEAEPVAVRTVHVSTDITGSATATWTLGSTAGVYRITATSARVPSVVFMLVARAGPMAQMTAVGDVQRGIAGTTLPWPLTVRVADVFSNPIHDVDVTFTVVSGGGSIGMGAGTTDDSGIAYSELWTLGTTPGEQQVRAQSGDFVVLFTANASTGEPCDVACMDAGRVAFVQDGNIYQIRARGTDLLQLTSGGRDGSPAWSPDGRRIAFSRTGVGLDGWGMIHVMDADGANVVQLANGWSPAWSPDSRRLAFGSHCDGNGCILVASASADGTSPIRLGNPRGYNNDPAWSPDGSRMAFVSDYVAYDFVFDIYVTTTDGASVSQLTDAFSSSDGRNYNLHPAWSPDGERIAFVYGRTINQTAVHFTVAVMAADGSGRRDLASAGDIPWMELLDPGSLSWSPDGSRIAFTRVGCDLALLPGCGATHSIRYVTVDGSQEGLIAPNGHSPSWIR